MKHTYGIAVPTFNGCHRVDVLLTCLDKAPSTATVHRKIVVEDKMPDHMESTANHAGLVAAVARHPGWELITLDKWSNMQGTAQKCMELCDTEFVFMISDDIACVGDPLRHFINYAENADNDIVEHIGGAALPIMHANTHLLNAGVFTFGTHWNTIQQFYADPLNTWLKDMQPIHYDTRWPQVPIISGQFNGAAFVLARKAWQEIGGFDLSWDVLDQYISYQIYFKTKYFILIINGDPFFHAGGCAQNGGWDELRARSKHAHSDERCREIFGDWIAETETRAREIAEKRQMEWGNTILKDFYKNLENSRIYQWRYV